jgi:hypothetical protein
MVVHQSTEDRLTMERALVTRLQQAGASIVEFADLSPLPEPATGGLQSAISFGIALDPEVVAGLAAGRPPTVLGSFVVANPCRKHGDSDLVLAADQLDEVGADQTPQGLVAAIYGARFGCQVAQPCALVIVLLAPEFVEETGLAEGSVDGGLDVGGFGPKAALIVEAPTKLVTNQLDQVGVTPSFGN